MLFYSFANLPDELSLFAEVAGMMEERWKVGWSRNIVINQLNQGPLLAKHITLNIAQFEDFLPGKHFNVRLFEACFLTCGILVCLWLRVEPRCIEIVKRAFFFIAINLIKMDGSVKYLYSLSSLDLHSECTTLYNEVSSSVSLLWTSRSGLSATTNDLMLVRHWSAACCVVLHSNQKVKQSGLPQITFMV